MKSSLRLQKLIEGMRGHYESNGDPGHDFNHILRVIENCKRIGSEVNADLEILIPAALLHDTVNLPKDHPERKAASLLASEKSATILRDFGYEESEIEKIRNVILEHSYSLGLPPSSVESKVLQDCDRLDALGAIGIMRTVTCGARMGAKYYDGNDPFADERPLDDKSFTLDHFYVKLFKLADSMNTNAAKYEAHQRLRFMESFINQLKIELGVRGKT